MEKPLPDLDELLEHTDTVVIERSEGPPEGDVDDPEDDDRPKPFLT